MPTPEQNATDPRPDQASTSASTPNQSSESDATTSGTPNLDTNNESRAETTSNAATSTQQHMGDGSGIRGDYGDASQTNGLEGGPDQGATDTELTGS